MNEKGKNVYLKVTKTKRVYKIITESKRFFFVKNHRAPYPKVVVDLKMHFYWLYFSKIFNLKTK